MTAYTAGDVARASALRELFPLRGYASADVTLTQAIDVTVIPGLSVIVEPRAIYAWEGYLAFDAGSTPDLSLSTLGLDASDGHWATLGLSLAGSTTGIGPVDARLTLGYGDRANVGLANLYGFSLAGGTGIAQTCLMIGTLITGDRGGALQVTFSQNTADAAATTIKAGSWIEVQKIRDR